MTEKTYQLPLTFEQILNLVLQLPEEEQEKIIQKIYKPALKNEKESKRATFGAMKDSAEILGDIVEPTSNLVTWEILSRSFY
jgi:hypothetical protein